MTSSPQRQRPAASARPIAEQRAFTLRFSATPRGARLARRLASQQMDAWGWAYGSPAHGAVELVVAELAANAVTHGRVPGRDAELRLTAEPCGTLVRVEGSDARGERRPVMPQGERPDMDGGRGLALVEALAGEWGVTERSGGPGKTVWAVVLCTAPRPLGPRDDVTVGSHGLHVPRWQPPARPEPRRVRRPPE